MQRDGAVNCVWRDVPGSTDERGWRRVVCVNCGRITNPTPHAFENIYADCRNRSSSGPGTELHRLLTSLVIKANKSCDCESWRRKMDQWGPDGCREREPEILAHLHIAYAKTDWPTVLAAGWASLTSGLAWRINPLDPLRSLLRLAIRRAVVPAPNQAATDRH